MHGPRRGVARVVHEPHDHDVRIRHLGGSRRDRRQRPVEACQIACFAGHSHGLNRIKARPTRLPRVALPERQHVEEELLDPTAIQRNYRRQRIKRRAREDRARERNLARLRFWLAVTAVLATSIVLAVVIWNQIQQLFGL